MKYIAFKFSTKSDKVERYFQENYPEFEQMWVNEFLQSNISHTYYFIIKRQIAGEKLLKTISYELSNICGGFYSYWGYKIYDCPPHEYHEKRLTDYLGQHAHYSEETLGIKRCLYEFGTLEEGSFKKYLLGILKEFNLGNLDEELVNNVLGILRQKRILLDLNDLKVIEKIFISYQNFPDSQIRLNALKLIGNFKRKFLKLWDWIRDYELDKRIIIYAIKKRRLLLNITPSFRYSNEEYNWNLFSTKEFYLDPEKKISNSSFQDLRSDKMRDYKKKWIKEF